jgi:hypothetical protein
VTDVSADRGRAPGRELEPAGAAYLTLALPTLLPHLEAVPGVVALPAPFGPGKASTLAMVLSSTAIYQ